MAGNPLSFYTGLITSEYQNSPNYLALVTALLKPISDTSNLLAGLDSAFDVDTAVGAQLDILGSIVGASRTVGFQPSDSISPVLDDDTYRILIKATVARNQWDGKTNSLYPIWQVLFPSGKIVIVDNQNMTVDITLTGAFTSIIQDLISHGYIVPRAQGVLINYHFGTLPMFGFDRQDSYIAGFDTGNWS